VAHHERVTEETLAGLVDEAVAVARGASSPEDYEAVWVPLRRAADASDAVIDVGLQMLGSDDPVIRATGCDLLATCFDGRDPGRHDVAGALVALAAEESDTDVQWSLAHALGRIGDPLGVEALVGLAGHADSDVRFQVAVALPAVAFGRRDDRVVDALIGLSRDPHREVRNWATFGLGRQLDDDSTRIREALWVRTEDEDPEVWEEAACGLARRHDERAVPLIASVLDGGDVAVWVFEAAATLGDPSLFSLLDGYGDDETVTRARRACDPTHRVRRDDACARLLTILQEQSEGTVWRLSCDRLGDPTPLLTTDDSDDSPAWSADQVLDAAGWDPEIAAHRIISQSVTLGR
jgi:HEAT repeat protein